MSSINKVIILGRVGKDPEVRYLPNQTPTATLSIATSESWNDKETGNKEQRTEWHRVVFWRKLAEIVGEYVKKGSLIYIEGKLVTRKWKDKDGSEKFMTEIVAHEMKMIPIGKKEDVERTRPVSEPEPAGGAMDDDFDDDIPF